MIVPPGHQHGDGILLAKGIGHLFGGQLPVWLVGKIGVVGVKDIGTVAGQNRPCNDHHQEDGGKHKAQLDHPFAPEVDLGHQIFVAGAVDGPLEHHQQAGHQQKDAQHGTHDALGQHDTHIKADAQLHEHQSHQAGDGGQAGGRDLHNGLAQGDNVRLPGVQAVVPLLHVPVAEDDGVVNGQSQLEHHGDGVGNKGDGAEDEVGAHVEHRRRHKYDEVDGHLHITLGGKKQHHHNHGGGDGQDDGHLLPQGGGGVPAHLGGQGYVVALQQVLHPVEGRHCLLIPGLPLKGDGEEGGGVLVVVGGVVKGHLRHPLHPLQPFGQGGGGVVGHVGHHHVGGAQGDKLLLHQGQAPPGLGFRRQIGGDVVVDLHLIDGSPAKDEGGDKDQKEGLPFIHNKAGQFGHRCLGFFVRYHRQIPLNGWG